MVYVEVVGEISRARLKEALQFYKDHIYERDNENIGKVGGKLIGCWSTQYGRFGEVTMLFAYPDLETRQRVLESSSSDDEWQKDVRRWFEYLPSVTVKVMRPTTWSPLQ